MNDECGVCDGDSSSCNQPTANDSNILVEEDQSVSFVLDADDPNGDDLSVNFISGPYNGSIDGSTITLTYTPNSDYFGDDDFVYSVSDGTWTSNEATVSIEVIPVNDSPVANDFTLEVSGGSGTVDFSNYVSDADQDALELLTMPPSSTEVLNTLFGGTLSPNGDGTYEYVAPDGVPSDFMLYKASDGIEAVS